MGKKGDEVSCRERNSVKSTEPKKELRNPWTKSWDSWDCRQQKCEIQITVFNCS